VWVFPLNSKFPIMKKLFVLTMFAVWGMGMVKAQFSDTTELAYLQVVNNSGNIDLVENNIPNAQSVAWSYIVTGKKSKVAPLLLMELAESCYFTSNFTEGFFYLIAQRYLFPDKKLSHAAAPLFYELAYAIGMDEGRAKELFEKTKKPKNTVLYNDYVQLTYTMVGLFDKKAENEIKFLIKTIYEKYGKLPYKLQHWLFLNTIGVKERALKKMWDNIADNQKEVYRQDNLNRHFRRKLYRKSIRHYIRIGAYSKARELVLEYRAGSPGILFYPDLWIKSLRCWLRI